MHTITKMVAYMLLLSICRATAQELPVSEIKKQIADLKKDIRGPYYRIKWFCKDGTIREPKDPCPDDIGGGIQHASYKQEVVNLGKKHHIFFGDILAYTNPNDFWDASYNHSRLKQYQLGKYLFNIDDGWILRKGQYYRGAVQSEDEQAWGIDFYNKILNENNNLQENFFLLKQSLRDIPHNTDTNLAQLMRSQSKVIAEEFPKFMDVRIKIHGKPDKSDIIAVSDFERTYSNELSPKLQKEFAELKKTLQAYYATVNAKELRDQVQELKTNHPIIEKLFSFLQEYENTSDPKQSAQSLSAILYTIREDITKIKSGSDRLRLLDISNDLEDVLLRTIQEWNPVTIGELLQKIYTLSQAAAGTGLLEKWEWSAIRDQYKSYGKNQENTIANLNEFLRIARSVVEWSAATVKANYEDIINRYATFEPLAYGFIDDRVRSTVALNLGDSVSILGKFIAEQSSMINQVTLVTNQSSIRGLNPGYAYGKLHVISGITDSIEVNSKDIYIFQKPPSDLKPVAGIMTVSEGNLVSHVQLLARNLGIPNAALSSENLKELSKLDGENVFYAVSNKGNVILKSEQDMTPIEKALFVKKERTKEKVTVPVDQIRLDVNKVLDMSEISARDSGKLCGPKAANLGQLKSMFPTHVVEGLVIPFGIFKSHMDQMMPEQEGSYWQFLNKTFSDAERMKQSEKNEKEIENYLIKQLSVLREAIQIMPLKQEFIQDLKDSFVSVFNSPIGKTPVFLRSDTNMEDLKEFTGAGLNLTLFNILSEEKIIKGIKEVWASPYTERSFKWRQQYLLNPENVFPSILIIPSVDVDYSGVLITKGINVGSEENLTVAFSRGAGGAVDGQSAETRLITDSDTSFLLAPARQPDYIRLPASGGITENTATFDSPILNAKNIQDINRVAQKIRSIMPKESEDNYNGAYDVELGFKDDALWLFQIRPFVENKKAKSSTYLNSISPTIDYQKVIVSTTKI